MPVYDDFDLQNVTSGQYYEAVRYVIQPVYAFDTTGTLIYY